jgi:hypothetical protein
MRKKFLKPIKKNIRRKGVVRRNSLGVDFNQRKHYLKNKFFSKDSQIKITKEILIKMRVIDIEALCSLLNIEIKYTFDKNRVVYYRPPVPPYDDSEEDDENNRNIMKYLSWEKSKKEKYYRAIYLIERIIDVVDSLQKEN